LSDLLHVLSLKLELGDADVQPRSAYPQRGSSTQASRPI
jgi:hypothetical protein